MDFRSFVAQLANNQIDTKDGGAVTDTNAESKVLAAKDVPVHPARPKALHNAKNMRAAAGRKGRTLTAMLTARSEAKYCPILFGYIYWKYIHIYPRKDIELEQRYFCYNQAASGGFKKKQVEEPRTNIDAADIDDQLAVVDYVEDIYSFYRKTEVWREIRKLNLFHVMNLIT